MRPTPRMYAAAATSAWPTEVGASSEPSTPEKSPPKPDGELEMDLLQAQVADAAESPSKKQKRTVTPESGVAGNAATGASAGPAPPFVVPPAAGQQVGPGSMTAGQMPASGVLQSQPWLLQTVAGAMSAGNQGNQGNQALLSPQGFSGGTGQSPRVFVPPEHAQLPLPASGAHFQQPASFSGGAGQMHPGQPRFGPPQSRPRSSGAPSSSHVGLPDQCPVRKSQGKVRRKQSRTRLPSSNLICRLTLDARARFVQWVLNPECSCGGGRKKLQAPTKVSRNPVTGEPVFVCTHNHCRSFFGGVCPHFQMCPHCQTLRSCNSMSNGVCRAGKGCRRRKVRRSLPPSDELSRA